MRWNLVALAVTTVLAINALAAPTSPAAVQKEASTATLLYNNDLDYRHDEKRASLLLVGGQTRAAAIERSACESAFHEQPLEQSIFENDEDSGRQASLLLRSALADGDLQPGDLVGLANHAAVTVEQSGALRTHNITAANAIHRVLCTQSETATRINVSRATSSNAVLVKSASSGVTWQGYRNRKTFRFLGIPYSEHTPRWTYARVRGIKGEHINATVAGKICPQPYIPANVTDEQCQYLNIWTPSVGPSARRRPVIVYLHGGAFLVGEGSDPLIDGANLASRGDIVVVSINYRLGNLGWLVVPGQGGLAGNYGFSDVVAALEWVRMNIANFGGDPSRVTIWGQSAGGTLVSTLLRTRSTHHLFQQAIVASQPGGYNFATYYAELASIDHAWEYSSKQIVNATGCSPAGSNVLDVVACLHKVPTMDLAVNIQKKLPELLYPRYVVVNSLVPNAKLEPANAAHITVMWGLTADDAAPFLLQNYSGTTREQAIRAVLDTAIAQGPNSYLEGSREGTSAQKYEPAVRNRTDLFPLVHAKHAGLNATAAASWDAFKLSSDIATDATFRCYAQQAARWSIWPRAYYYEFQRTLQRYFAGNVKQCNPPDGADPSTADYLRCHNGELMFQWGNFPDLGVGFRGKDEQERQRDLKFTRLAIDYWAAFIRTGDPNPDVSWLRARGYHETADVVAKAAPWEVSNMKGHGRGRAFLFDVQPQSSGMIREEQCGVLGLPIS